MTPEELIRQTAHRYDSGNGEGEALTASTLARLAYRRSHGGKQCDVCRETKPVSAFGQDRSRPDGLRRACRECRARAYRRATKHRVNTPLAQPRPSPLVEGKEIGSAS